MTATQFNKNKTKDAFPFSQSVRGSVYTTFQTFESSLHLNRKLNCSKKKNENSNKGLYLYHKIEVWRVDLFFQLTDKNLMRRIFRIVSRIYRSTRRSFENDKITAPLTNNKLSILQSSEETQNQMNDM